MFRIGFFTEEEGLSVQASTRIRVLEVINMFKFSLKYKVGFYEPQKKYDIVIFQKTFKSTSLKTAKKMKKAGAKVIFDINIDAININWDIDQYFGAGTREIYKSRLSTVEEFCRVADTVITPSHYLAQVYRTLTDSCCVIGESINSKYFKIEPPKRFGSEVKLVYCGYAVKAKELNLVAEELAQIQRELPVSITCVSEKKPNDLKLDFEFVKYEQNSIGHILSGFDIKIAPRDLQIPYNLGHSATKITLPMALGLPAVCSKVPSYQNLGITIENNEWYPTLKKLVLNKESRTLEGKVGRERVKGAFSTETIKKQYMQLWEALL